MSARVGFWVVGPGRRRRRGRRPCRNRSFPAARPVVFGSAFLLDRPARRGRSRSRSGRPPRRPRPRDTRPADGRVDLAARRRRPPRPNPIDPRFGAFLGLDDAGPAGPSRPDPAPRRSPPLLGRVVIVSLFVGRDGRAWSDAEIAEAHRALVRAAAWVEAEAIRYGAAVNLELADTYFVVRRRRRRRGRRSGSRRKGTTSARSRRTRRPRRSSRRPGRPCAWGSATPTTCSGRSPRGSGPTRRSGSCTRGRRGGRSPSRSKTRSSAG